MSTPLRIASAKVAHEAEPLAAPWGFKGGFLTELWQVAVRLGNHKGMHSLGLGVQSVLWSDPEVFAAHSEHSGNRAMLAITQAAANALVGQSFDNPGDWIDAVLPKALAEGRKSTGRRNLRTTFALNALVGLDFAAWTLWARERGLSPLFENLIPNSVRPMMVNKANKIACVPAVGYALSIEDVVQSVRDGYFLLKIKVGSDPDKDGNPDKMLAWDIARLSEIHQAVRDLECPGFPDNRVRYYLDANGRYDSLDRVHRLLDACEDGDFLDHVLMLEEPFPESAMFNVSQLPIRVVADERAHTDEEVREAIDLGYGAIALKPIAKTLTMSFRMAQAASERGVPCFCADLTVNPILVEWNKLFQAHLRPPPGLPMGILESNGHQNYRNWDQMVSYHPMHDSPWVQPQLGVWNLSKEFYRHSGGVDRDSDHYTSLFAE